MDSDIPTYVYVMKCGEWAKIGVAENTDRRLRGVLVNCPYPVELVARRRFPRLAVARRVEHYLHEVLRHQLHRGEWFVAQPDDPAQLLADVYTEEAIKYGWPHVEGLMDEREPPRRPLVTRKNRNAGNSKWSVEARRP